MSADEHAALVTQPRFRPWVGERYHSEGRVLVVGESHHGPARHNDDPHFTSSGIRAVISGSWSKLRYFKNLQRVFAAHLNLDETCKAQFWNGVAFYNYVQEMISRPGIAPSRRALNEAAAPFRHVVEELQPHCILFACKRLFHEVTNHYEIGAPLHKGADKRATLAIPHATGTAVATYILHPTYRGFRKQQAWVTALVRRGGVVVGLGAG